jgi:long-chain fatty acid transport protein
MIAATNPAGMVYVGARADVGAAIFSPSPRGYTATAPGGAATFPLAPQTVESDSDYFLIPHFAYNWVINPTSTVGVTVYGNGGMNTDYSASANVFGAGEAGVNLEQLFINASYSVKVNPSNALGVSAILAYQRFEAKGLAGFGAFSSDSANLTNNGVDTSTGYGLKVGWLGEVATGLRLAASYQSKMDMSKFDKYRGLFAEHGNFDIPATWTVGLAWDIQPKNTLTFDVQKIMYSDVKAIANPLLPNLGASQLGNDDGAGFGWEDMTIYKLGYQWETSSIWTWRVGYSHGDQPIPNSEVLFNILAPAVMEDHFTFGFTRNIGKDAEFNFAAMYSPKNDVTGPNPLGDGQQVTLEMTQYEVEASYSWKF